MKQVKTLLMAITLLIGIGLPQFANAQEKRIVTPEDIALLDSLGVDTNMKRNELKGMSISDFIGKEYAIDVLIENIKEDQLINLVGKWINSETFFREFYADSTMISRSSKGVEFTVEGTDISYPVKARIWHATWKREYKSLTILPSEIEYVLGDISYYPADIQNQIKADIERTKNDYSKNPSETEYFVLSSFSPDTMILKNPYREEEYQYVRDISGISAQEKNEYNKELEKWNQIKKEKEKKKLQAALERDNLAMAKLKAKAIASGNQYDYWIIGHLYEFGDGYNELKITICLDSALVWYKKAAAIDSKNEEYVTAVTHKIKTGGDYYEDKQKSDIAAKKKQIAQVRAAYTKKYGANNSNYLSKQATIVKGMPLAFIREYINDFNRIGFYALGNQLLLRLQEYKPTQRDMMQFGRAVKSYRLISGSEPIWSFLILNGKVVSGTRLSLVYQLISMNGGDNE